MSEGKERIFQQQAVDTTINAISKGKDKVLLSMAQGTGSIQVIVSILKKYYKSKKGIYNIKSLCITNNMQSSIQLTNELIREFGDDKIVSNIEKNTEFKIPITVDQIKAIRNAEGLLFPEHQIELIQFQLIIFLECEKIGLGKTDDFIQKIFRIFKTSVFIGIDNETEKSQMILGEPIFIYSLNQAIQDSIFVPVKNNIVHLKNISRKEVSDKLVQEVNKLSEFDLTHGNSITNQPKNELILQIAKAILDIVNETKTVIVCPSEKVAKYLSFTINNLKEDKKNEYSRIINPKGVFSNELISKFNSETTPIILLAINNNYTGIDLPITKGIVFLNNVLNAQVLTQLLTPVLRPFNGKKILNIYDFVELETILKDVISEYSAIETKENQESLKLIYKKTEFRFKDRNDISPVLGVTTIAKEIGEIIEKLPKEKGAMVGVFGRWGRGKTFLMEEIWKYLNTTKGFHKIDFHAWKYQDTPAVWAYLFEQFSFEFYNTSKSWYLRIWKRFVLNWFRLGGLKLLWFLFSFSASFLLALYVPIFAKIKFLTWIGLGSVLSLIILYYRYGESAKDVFSSYFSKVSFSRLMGVQAEVQKELALLIETWTKYFKCKHIILHVDDIDRCSESSMIQIVDSLRIMLEDEVISKHVVVIAAIDEEILKRAINSKYSHLLQNENASYREIEIGNLAKEYLDKLFIFGIKLGEITIDERDEYFLELTKENIGEYQIEQFRNLDSNLDIYSLSIFQEILDDKGYEDYKSEDTESENKKYDSNIKNRIPDSHEESTKNTGKLSREEFYQIRVCLKKFVNTTPRQIRVFYYRYLFAKGLLISQYMKSEKLNIWLTYAYLPIFIELIFYFSKDDNLKQLKLLKRNSELNKNTHVKIDYLTEKPEIQVSDYYELLRILEIVIAY